MSDKPRKRSGPTTAIEVARIAGVSQSAVSRAFTLGASVSPAARERIMVAARQLGYRPNAIARSLIMGRSRLIGIIVAYMENQFYPEVIEAISLRLQALDYHVILFSVDATKSVDPAFESLMNYRLDGIILASAMLSSGLASECAAHDVPVVLFNRKTDSAELSSVTGDNRKGAAQIAAFLAGGNHKRFGFIAGIEAASTSRDREHGYTAWLRRAGLGDPARAVGHYSFAGASAATRDLLSRKARPDAIFCANDHTAIAAIEVARHEFGIDVGREVSIVGFDDVGAARWPSYGLTTFSQPVMPMVDETIAILMDLIERKSGTPRQAVIPGDLVVRSSARVPKQGVVETLSGRIWQPEKKSRKR